MSDQPTGIYKTTIRIEVPVIISEADVPAGAMWDDLRLAALEAVDSLLPTAIREVADMSAMTGPGGSGFFPDGMQHDYNVFSNNMDKIPVTGLKSTIPVRVKP
jgi:hypothetical protein